MSKNLRIDVSEDQYHRFNSLKGDLRANTNDECLISLMDKYEDYKELKDKLESQTEE